MGLRALSNRVNTAVAGGPGGASGVLPLIIAKSAVAVSGTNTTSEEAYATVTIPAGSLGANGAIRVTAEWSYTNNANSKTLRVRYSSLVGTQIFGTAQTTSIGLRSITTIANRGATNSQVGSGFGVTDSGAIAVSKNTASVDTTAATTVVISGQKAVGTDTCTLESYIVEIIYGS